MFRILKDMPAGNPRIVFDKVRRIPFHKYFSAEAPVKIQVASAIKNEKLPNHLVGSKIREAVNDSFAHFQKKEANVSSRDAKVSLKGFLHGKRMALSIDTSLNSLHKRGYRVEGHPAPLKETLAATLLKFSEYDGTQALYDPMCGSGSIIIEGAQIAMNKAPLIHRKKGEFGFEHLKDFNGKLWRQVQDETRGQQSAPSAPLFASDISQEYLSIARQGAMKARVEKYIEFSQGDFSKSRKPCESGLMIANIPYGLRLDEQDIGKDYLRQLGDHIKGHFKGWRCGILLLKPVLISLLVYVPTKKISLVNGSVPVKFLVFDIY